MIVKEHNSYVITHGLFSCKINLSLLVHNKGKVPTGSESYWYSKGGFGFNTVSKNKTKMQSIILRHFTYCILHYVEQNFVV